MVLTNSPNFLYYAVFNKCDSFFLLVGPAPTYVVPKINRYLNLEMYYYSFAVKLNVQSILYALETETIMWFSLY